VGLLLREVILTQITVPTIHRHYHASLQPGCDNSGIIYKYFKISINSQGMFQGMDILDNFTSCYNRVQKLTPYCSEEQR